MSHSRPTHDMKNETTMKVHSNNNNIFEVSITETSTFNEVIDNLTVNTDCPNCMTCQLRKRSCRMYSVDRTGQPTIVNKEANVVEMRRENSFYLSKESFTRLLVVHFPDQTFVSCLIDQFIKTSDLFFHSLVSGKLKKLKIESPTLTYQVGDEFAICESNEKPVLLLYDKQGNLINNGAKFVFLHSNSIMKTKCNQIILKLAKKNRKNPVDIINEKVKNSYSMLIMQKDKEIIDAGANKVNEIKSVRQNDNDDILDNNEAGEVGESDNGNRPIKESKPLLLCQVDNDLHHNEMLREKLNEEKEKIVLNEKNGLPEFNKLQNFDSEHDAEYSTSSKTCNITIQDDPEQERQFEHPKLDINIEKGTVMIKCSTANNSKCESCSKLQTKPLQIKSKESMKRLMNDETKRETYICLTGTHFRYQNRKWNLTDDCEIKTNKESENSQDGSRSVRFNIGNGFICTLIPKGVNRTAHWLIKKTVNNTVGENTATNSSSNETDLCKNSSQYVKKTTSCPNENDTNSFTTTSNSIPCIDGLLMTSHKLTSSEVTSSETTSSRMTLSKTTTPKAMKTKIFNNVISTMRDAKNNIDTKQMQEIAKNTKTLFLKSVWVTKDKISTTFSKNDEIDFDIIEFRRIHIKPLQFAIVNICCKFENESKIVQRVLADDRQTSEIGWLVRMEFSSVIANLLRTGLSDISIAASVKSLILYKNNPLTLWYIVKDFSQTFRTFDFNGIIHVIEESKYLINEDMKFRFFICELLNSDHDSDKLIVTWFQSFRSEMSKLALYYDKSSFWRLKYYEHFSSVFDEIIFCLSQLNGIPFRLHDSFELQSNRIMHDYE